MQPETRHDFRLNFRTTLNELMTLNIPRANTAATGAEVSNAMQAIIDSNVVRSVRGTPLSRYSAELVTVERSDFDLQ